MARAPAVSSKTALITITTRLCIDCLRDLKQERARYIALHEHAARFRWLSQQPTPARLVSMRPAFLRRPEWEKAMQPRIVSQTFISQIAAFFQFAFVPLMPWHVKIGQSKPTVDHFMWDDTQ
jgi:hypothetical protein